MKTQSRLEITTTNEVLQFDLPEGEGELAKIRLDGEELHDVHQVAMMVKQQSRFWAGLGVFLGLAAAVALVLGSWIVHRLNALPADTAQIQSMIDNQHPPAFHAGDMVETHNGETGQITKYQRGKAGNWIYKVGGEWVGQGGLSFISHSSQPATD